MIYFRGPKGIEKLLSYFGAERTKVAKRYTDCVTIDSSWARSSTNLNGFRFVLERETKAYRTERSEYDS